MMHSLSRAVCVALLVAVASLIVSAAEPTFWQVSTEADLLAGEATSVSIDARGRLTLGPAVSTIYEASVPFLWNLIADDAGRLYVGSGNDGQVYRLNTDGQATLIFDAEEIEVHALALAPDGTLYAGTSPGGRIYRITEDGAASVFFDPEGEYLWSLAVDDDGTVFAAAGEPGHVYRIAPDGTGTIFYRTEATHAMTLALANDGTVLVGTASPGRIFRLDPSGRPFVLLDSPYSEIHQLRLAADGTLYAAALSAPGSGAAPAAPPPSGSGQASTTVTTSGTATVSVTTSTSVSTGASTPARTASGVGVGAVYRIQVNGAWDRVWQSAADVPYDLAVEPDGSLLVATGNAGRVFRLAGDPLEATLLTESPSQQVTALARSNDGGLLLATANPGRILSLAPQLAASGTYLSVVRDTNTVASWGSISWQGTASDGRIEISTRSGNTRTPDETWSDWSPTYTDPRGTPITSPMARFIQWRAELTRGAGAPPTLDSVTTAYLPRNTPPRVESITLHPPGTVFQQTFPVIPDIAGFTGDRPERELSAGDGNGAPALGRREYQPGLLTFVWQAADDEQDELQYTVQYRRETASDWTILRDDLNDPILVWDTTAVPNGRYVLRIVASDDSSNSPTTRLTGQLDSEAFEIDNTAPVIAVASVLRDGDDVVVTFDVRDADSTVARAEFSLDGARWQAVYPLDGIADSRTENYQIRLAPATAAQVVIRASDVLRNTSTISSSLSTQ